jgi:hypothetical protein
MRIPTLAMALLLTAACGDDADSVGIAAECSKDDDCNQDTDPPLECLRDFRGGYCGLSGCTGNVDCPEDGICVTHTDGFNYCFRICTDKEADCNANRSSANLANCSSNITRVDGGTQKACVPPSS